MVEPSVEQTLTALAGPPELSEPPVPHGDVMLERFSRGAWQANQLRGHLVRLQMARQQLPAARLAFTVDCLQPWETEFVTGRKAMKETRNKLRAAATSTPPNSDARRESISPVLAEHLRIGEDHTILTVLYGPIRRARQRRAAVRIGLLALVAFAAIFVESIAGLSAVRSILFALVLYVVVDVGVVDRWVEPALVRAEEDALDRAIAEAIPMTERLSDGLRHIAASLQEGDGRAGVGD